MISKYNLCNESTGEVQYLIKAGTDANSSIFFKFKRRFSSCLLLSLNYIQIGTSRNINTYTTINNFKSTTIKCKYSGVICTLIYPNSNLSHVWSSKFILVLRQAINLRASLWMSFTLAMYTPALFFNYTQTSQ